MRSTPYLATLLSVALLCMPARADEAAKQEARVLFEQGNQHAADGDYAGALTLFRSAYARYAGIKILLNIGTMLHQLGRNAEAADVYEAYMRDPAADSSKKAKVEKLLADLDTRVAKLRVEVDDGPATVRVDGNVVGQPGKVVSMRVEPGPHAVSAEREGGPPALMNVTAVAGEEAQVQLQMPPRPPPAPPPPLPPPAPAAARNPVGKPDATSTVPVLPDARWRSGQRIVAYAVGSVGLAELVVGGIMGGLTLAKKGTIEENCNLGGVPNLCNHTGKVAADSAQTTGLISMIGFGTGLAGVGVATVLLLTEPKKKSVAGRGWTNIGVLAVGETGVVLGVGGTW